MAYTKEQREIKKAEKEALMRAEIEAQIRAEYSQSLKEKLSSEKPVVDKAVTADNLQKMMKIPLDTVVPVTCNVQGGAIYVSKKLIGHIVVWDEYGSTEYVELSELVAMRNSDRRFFQDNWIVCEDTSDYTAVQIYSFLKVSQYYEHVFTPENIDSIFDESPKNIIKMIAPLSAGMKNTIATRAKIKIDAKEIDSNSKIEALEAVLGIEFGI